MSFVAINSGELNRRATLYRPPRSLDSFGGFDPATLGTAVATFWVGVRSLGGSEQTHGEQVNAVLTHEITSRYAAVLIPVGGVHVLVIEGRRFQVDSVHDVDEAHVKLLWLCAEVRNG